MRRLLLTTAIVILAIQAQAQIFGTGQTLSPINSTLASCPQP